MEFIYYILIALCLLMELSSGINTRNIFKKVALLLIIIGCLLHIADRNTQMLAELGMFCYLLVDVLICYMSKRTSK